MSGITDYGIQVLLSALFTKFPLFFEIRRDHTLLKLVAADLEVVGGEVLCKNEDIVINGPMHNASCMLCDAAGGAVVVLDIDHDPVASADGITTIMLPKKLFTLSF